MLCSIVVQGRRGQKHHSRESGLHTHADGSEGGHLRRGRVRAQPAHHGVPGDSSPRGAPHAWPLDAASQSEIMVLCPVMVKHHHQGRWCFAIGAPRQARPGPHTAWVPRGLLPTTHVAYRGSGAHASVVVVLLHVVSVGIPWGSYPVQHSVAEAAATHPPPTNVRSRSNNFLYT